jgi:hypothetical protein
VRPVVSQEELGQNLFCCLESMDYFILTGIWLCRSPSRGYSLCAVSEVVCLLVLMRSAMEVSSGQIYIGICMGYSCLVSLAL